MRIGVISDTHLPSIIRRLDEMGSKAEEILSTVELILHAGDVIAPSVIAWCESFAPVRIARGNNDLFDHPQLSERHLFHAKGWRIGLVHEARPESRPMREILDETLDGEPVDVFISGDTHVQRLELRENLIFLNPGSPTLPHHKEWRLGTMGLLTLSEHEMTAEIVCLGDTPGAPNPGTPARLTVRRKKGGLQVTDATT